MSVNATQLSHLLSRERCQYTHEGHPSLPLRGRARVCLRLTPRRRRVERARARRGASLKSHYNYSPLSLRTFPIIALSALPSLNVKYRVSPETQTRTHTQPMRVCARVCVREDEWMSAR